MYCTEVDDVITVDDDEDDVPNEGLLCVDVPVNVGVSPRLLFSSELRVFGFSVKSSKTSVMSGTTVGGANASPLPLS